MRLTEKYRPHRFEDVRGQDHVVRVLSGYIIKGQVPRDLLLLGSVGSGKTSLARIYGRALNCDHPLSSGSPCETCRACQEADGFIGYSEYDVAGWGGSLGNIAAFLESHRTSPAPPGKVKVLCFDEAHLLTKEAAESLLKAVEDRGDSLAYCFATTEPERLPPALRSRLIPIQVRPLTPDVAIEWLRQIATAEGIAIDHDAIKLIVGLRRGYPRDLLNALELVRFGQSRVTLELVRELFDVDHIDVLPSYFVALADGDSRLASDLFFDWQESTAEKVRWIQSFLVSLYFGEILRLRWTVDAAVEAISLTERRRVLERWCEKVGVDDVAMLRRKWLELIAFWRDTSADDDESVLLSQLALFHAHLSRAGDGNSDGQANPRTVSVVPSSPEIDDCFQPARQLDAIPPPQDPIPDGYLQFPDVRRVIDTASFLIQEHGLLFNAAVELKLVPLGPLGEQEAIDLIDRFGESLLNWRRTTDRPSALLRSVARDGNVFIGHFAVHLPPLAAQSPADRGTLVDEIKDLALADFRDHGVLPEFAVEIAPIGTLREQMAFQWSASLGLLLEMDPRLLGYDDRKGAWRPLFHLLGIRQKDLRSTGPLPPHGIICGAGLLDRRSIQAACVDKMAALSVFQARAWTTLRSGWEIDEHADRVAIRREREAQILNLMSKHPGDSVALGVALDELRSSWPSDPRHRPRSYLPWWVT